MYLCHTILTISTIFSHLSHTCIPKSCLHISIFHPHAYAYFSKYAKIHTHLLQTHKNMNETPKGSICPPPREDKSKQKKCEINKKVHYSIETQQDFWSERKIARGVEHLSYTTVTSICLQKSIYLYKKITTPPTALYATKLKRIWPARCTRPALHLISTFKYKRNYQYPIFSAFELAFDRREIIAISDTHCFDIKYFTTSFSQGPTNCIPCALIAPNTPPHVAKNEEILIWQRPNTP